MRPLLLIAPATSYRVPAFVAAAQRLGLALAIGSDVPAAHAAHGVPVFKVELGDPVRGADDCLLASSEGYRGALGTDDASALVAAHVAARLGLSANDPEGVLAARDKRRMRARLAVAGVAQPAARVLEPDADVAAFAAATRYPCVVKPPMLTGSQGVIRADDPAALVAAVARVRRILDRHASSWKNGADFWRLLVEDFVDGPEIAVEALLDAGRLVPLAVFDKPDPLDGPFFEETLYVTPSRHAPELIERACAVVSCAAQSLGLVTGPIHAELRLAAGGAQLIEIAARSIGGLCSRTLELAANNLEELLLRQLAGVAAPAPAAPRQAAGVMMIPIEKSGVLKQVDGLEAARAVPGITGVEITTRPGEALRKLPEGASYLGFIFARGTYPADVEAALRAAHRALRFELSPLLELG